MELLQFIFLLCLLLVTLAALSFKNRGFKPNAGSTSALPPSRRALPIIGHLHHLIGSSLPHHALRDLSLRHGPLIFLRLGRVDHVVASSSEAAAEIPRTHDLSFASRPLRPRLKSFTYDFTDIAFSPYGPYWRQLRKICVMHGAL